VRRLKRVVAALAAIAGTGVLVERCGVAAPRYHGAPSDHFDGAHFHNRSQVPRGEGSVLHWMLARERGAWPAWVDAPYGPPPPKRVGRGALRVTFINHATMLIQLDEVNILTDPIWSERTSPFSFAGPKRHRPPGIRFEELPHIDVVLVSHNHYDHLDVPTLRALVKRDAPRIITPLGNAALMAKRGITGVVELDWWQSSGNVTCVPSQHFSSRAISDRDANLWGGFVIGSPSGNVYFAGDSGWGPHFAEIGHRFAPIRLAMIPIGAYLPRWFMKPVHIDPAEAVEAHRQLGASTSVAMHFGTFQLSDETIDQPVHDLSLALAAAGHPRFWVLGQGEGREVP
jgi:L-ascorbate metabolism protein UlaG (beta-lactamase superfamily)